MTASVFFSLSLSLFMRTPLRAKEALRSSETGLATRRSKSHSKERTYLKVFEKDYTESFDLSSSSRFAGGF